MSTNLERASHFLLLLKETRLPQAKALLLTLDNHQALAISEIVFNLLEGSISLCPQLKSKLARKKDILHLIGSKKTSMKARKALIAENSGLFITVVKHLLPPL